MAAASVPEIPFTADGSGYCRRLSLRSLFVPRAAFVRPGTSAGTNLSIGDGFAKFCYFCRNPHTVSRFTICIVMLAILANACGRTPAADLFDVILYSPLEAEGFEIAGSEGCDSRVIRVKTAWQGDGSAGMKDGQERLYGKELFIARNGETPPEGFKGQVLYGEAERIAAMSSTHIAMLDIIGEVSRVKAVSGMRFISNGYVRAHCDSIADIGNEADADFEALVSSEPDIVLLYGVSSASPMESRLRSIGIPCLYIGEYLERTPLGRAEWVVALAELAGCREKGEKAFGAIKAGYDSLKAAVPDSLPKPKVMLNSPYGDTWFMASPQSAMAAMIRDAGGEYIFDRMQKQGDGGTNSMESVPVDFESAFLMVSEADVWLNVGQYGSAGQLTRNRPELSAAECVMERRVYSCDRRMSDGGGSDFWESGAVRPDLILHDLIRILHPELEVPDMGHGDNLYYYRRLE